MALTFDAGANADGVQSILATLAKYHVPATFFLTGNFVRDFPAQAKAIAAAGHRIGDHSVSHPYFTTLTDAQIRDQVLSAESQITSVTYRRRPVAVVSVPLRRLQPAHDLGGKRRRIRPRRLDG